MSQPALAHTLITIATYNEMENLPRLVDAIFTELPDAHVLVIDDNSPDGTGAWCDQRAATDSRVRCLHREGKLGLGTATIAGLRHAIDHGYELALNMDADFSHDPRHLPAMLQPMSGTAETRPDVVIGSRYVAGGGTRGWPWRRQWMSRAVNLYARWLLWLPARDTSGAYRCYRTEMLRRLDFNAIQSRGYSFQEEILWHLRRAGARMVETPIIFVDRQHGESKINMREAWSAVGIIFRLGCRTWLGGG